VLLVAQMLSTLGRWMQLLGAQWLMVDRAPALVALVTTATSLPVMVFALLGGAWADTFDRRRMMVLTQGGLTVTAAVLAVAALEGRTAAWLVLLLMFLMGTGQALNIPPWQSVAAEVVPPKEMVQAATLTVVSSNIARAVGPALGGAAVILTGIGGVFVLSAACFGLALLFTARSGAVRRPERSGERLFEALWAAARYVGRSTTTQRILLWTCIFVPTNAGLWALLPSVAKNRLGLDAAGYGLLLAMVGAGALVGAVAMPVVKRWWSANLLFAISIGTIGVTTIAATVLPNAWLAGALLLPLGAAYIAVIALLNATLQLLLPPWVRARGLAVFLVAFFATMAAGSAAWGLVANQVGASVAVAISGASLLAFVPLLRWLRFPEPRIAGDAELAGGAASVT
jgi:MFS family permease